MTILTKPPQIRPDDWPGQTVTLGSLQERVYQLQERCRVLEARNGGMIDRLRAMCNDPATSEEMRQAIGDVINS